MAREVTPSIISIVLQKTEFISVNIFYTNDEKKTETNDEQHYI